MKQTLSLSRRFLPCLAGLMALVFAAGCSEDPKPVPAPVVPAPGISLDTEIHPYDGQTAQDINDDKPSSNTDFYWKDGEFAKKLEIIYNGDDVEVTSSDENIIVHTDGAYVTVDMLTKNVSDVQITAKGSSADGQLKIYGASRTLLNLDGLDLTSKRGPAINNQNKKRLFVKLGEGTVNRLADAPEYRDDPYYMPGSSAVTEDRKGCFFSEGHLILCGAGVLRLTGNYRHGLVTDGYLYVRPGVTLVVDDAARNAIHVKGDVQDGYGVHITGGYVYANTSAPAGRAIRCDHGVNIYSGQVTLYTSGDAAYDAESLDLQSAAGIKADYNINLVGGKLNIVSTGKGGKGINTASNVYLSGTSVMVAATGDKAEDEGRGLSSSSKGVKADSNCVISGGEMIIYSMDDALSATSMRMTDGSAWICSIDKDGIDVAENFTLSKGLLIASGDGNNASGIDCPVIQISGGTVVSTGGVQSAPATGGQPYVLSSLGDLGENAVIGVSETASATPMMAYILPRATSLQLLYSSPTLPPAGSTVYLRTGGSVSSPEQSWNGYLTGQAYSGGQAVAQTVR